MKKYFILSLVLAFLVLQLSAQTVWTSIASGNWSAASTWVRTGSGGGTAATPPSSLGNNQRVVITGGFTVTQSNDITLDGSARLTIQNGGRLNMGNDKNLSQKNDNNQFIITM